MRGEFGGEMSIEITHVRFGSTRKTEDEIISYKWKNDQTAAVGQRPESVAAVVT